MCPGTRRKGLLLSFAEKCSDAWLRIQSSDKVTSISLPAAPAYHAIEFELDVLSVPPAPATPGDRDTLGTPEPPAKPKDRPKAGLCMASTDHKVGLAQAAVRTAGLRQECYGGARCACRRGGLWSLRTPGVLLGMSLLTLSQAEAPSLREWRSPLLPLMRCRCPGSELVGHMAGTLACSLHACVVIAACLRTLAQPDRQGSRGCLQTPWRAMAGSSAPRPRRWGRHLFPFGARSGGRWD